MHDLVIKNGVEVDRKAGANGGVAAIRKLVEPHL